MFVHEYFGGTNVQNKFQSVVVEGLMIAISHCIIKRYISFEYKINCKEYGRHKRQNETCVGFLRQDEKEFRNEIGNLTLC